MKQHSAINILENLYSILIEMNKTAPIETDNSFRPSERSYRHLSKVDELLKLASKPKTSFADLAKKYLSDLKQNGLEELKGMLSPKDQVNFLPVFSKINDTDIKDVESLLKNDEFVNSIKELKAKTENRDDYSDIA